MPLYLHHDEFEPVTCFCGRTITADSTEGDGQPPSFELNACDCGNALVTLPRFVTFGVDDRGCLRSGPPPHGLPRAISA